MARTKVKHNHSFGVLGHIFCATEKNKHRPHILRGTNLLIISFIGVFLLGVSFARYYFLHETVLGQEVVSSVLIDLTNETRLAYGKTPLIRNHKLENAAQMKAEDMAEYQYFAHNSPTGVTPWYWVKKAGYDFLYAGENLAIDFTQSQDVEEAWMKSPTHKANILNSKFEEIGIATKEGIFNGHNTIYVVQTFATPKAKTEIVKEKSSSEENIPYNNVSQTYKEADKEDNQIGEVAGVIIKNPNKEIDKELKDKNILLAQNNSSSSSAQNQNTDQNTSQNIQSTATAGATMVARDVKEEEYITLLDDNNTIIVADKEAYENSTNTNEFIEFNNNVKIVKYSNFWQKLIYNFWYDINIFYKVIVTAIMIGLIFLFFVEFRRHHWLHMFYGVITIIIMLLLFYINQSIW